MGKKHRKHLSSPDAEEHAESKHGRSKEMKRKHNSANVSSPEYQLQTTEECTQNSPEPESRQKAKLNKKARRREQETYCATENTDEPHVKKVRHKQQSHPISEQDDVKDSEAASSETHDRKHGKTSKKCKSKKTKNSNNVGVSFQESDGCQNGPVPLNTSDLVMKKKKKKKKSKHQNDDVDEDSGISKSVNITNVDQANTSENHVNGHIHKKKKKMSDPAERNENIDNLMVNGGRSDSNCSSDLNVEHADEVNGVVKKKKKKSKKRKETEEGVLDTCKNEISDELKKKKKSKKRKRTEDDALDKCPIQNSTLDTYKVENTEEMKKKKSKKGNEVKNDIIHDCTHESSGKVEKKMKKSKKGKEPDDTDKMETVVSENISTSDNTEASKHTAGLKQWATAELDSSERQNKFFRLLGGMKKEGSAASSGKPPMAPVTKFNMALNKKQSQHLEQALENQFEQARNLKMSGSLGGGLGYQPPPDKGKHFYIDRTKSMSVKFDD